MGARVLRPARRSGVRAAHARGARLADDADPAPPEGPGPAARLSHRARLCPPSRARADSAGRAESARYHLAGRTHECRRRCLAIEAAQSLAAEWSRTLTRAVRALELATAPEPAIGLTPKQVVYRRNKARLYRYESSRTRPVPVLFVPNLGISRPVDLRPPAGLLLRRAHVPAGVRLLPPRLGRLRRGGQRADRGRVRDPDPPARRPQGAGDVRRGRARGDRLLHGRAALGVVRRPASRRAGPRVREHGGAHRLRAGGALRAVARQALLRRGPGRRHGGRDPGRLGQGRIQAPPPDHGRDDGAESLVEPRQPALRRGLSGALAVGERLRARSRRSSSGSG